ncbi:lysoplasmalogenase family protein [Brachybacterium sp. AOP43-C2-M15]|uniref:lysoplasmalogenase family protein n=1 Tax=Brachybacterium sp. AOP43-C2-M15 TaxID=3457661 RepID=UPI0040338B6E
MRAAIAGLVVVSAVHLAAQLLGLVVLAALTQVLLMPLLALALWRGTRSPRARLVTLVLVALGFSWIGDVIPRLVGGDAGFLGMVGGFLVAQLVYAAAFWPYRRGSLLGGGRTDRGRWGRRAALLPYLAVALVTVVLSAAGAGPLLPAVILYAGAITVMAVLSTGVGRLGGLGGAVFMVSDALIALEAFAVLTLPAHPVWVMTTYITAQLLIVLAVHRLAVPHVRGGRVSDGDSRRDPPWPAPARDAWPP